MKAKKILIEIRFFMLFNEKMSFRACFLPIHQWIFYFVFLLVLSIAHGQVAGPPKPTEKKATQKPPVKSTPQTTSPNRSNTVDPLPIQSSPTTPSVPARSPSSIQ